MIHHEEAIYLKKTGDMARGRVGKLIESREGI